MKGDYRVVSDGTPVGTHVFGPNGHELKYVRAISWYMDASGHSRATIDVPATLEIEVPESDTMIVSTPESRDEHGG